MVRVKICGNTTSEDVQAVVSAGADALGFITGFPASPRNLTLQRAARLIQEVPPLVDAVLVTNVETLMRELGNVSRIAASAIQLYGEPSGNDLKRIGEATRARLIKVVRIGADERYGTSGFDAVLTDTYVRGKDGGTGMVSDWDACLEVKRRVAPLPLILSGGLTPLNVADAIVKVNPFAVDVVSGVESSPGLKDVHKVMSFVMNAKGAGR